MSTILHQIQGLYTAGDVFSAIDCVRAAGEYDHVFYVNHSDGFDDRLFNMLTQLGVEVRRNTIVKEADLSPGVCAVFYHCVGHDEERRGEYVHFRREPPGITLCAWVHTPGLCGAWSERYNYLRDRGCSCLIFNSSFSLHNTPGIDLSGFETCAIINPAVDTEHYASITRTPDGVFRIGRWSRGHDTKYSDDFLELITGIDIPGVEFLCMGIPPKFRGHHLPAHVRFIENGAMSVEELLSQLDVLIFKTHASTWHEGWCRTVTEAMAAGVVPVVENRGGIPDQVIHGYNGFLCSSNDEFKHYCRLLYQDSSMRARMSANARAFASANFSLTNLGANLRRIIEPGPMRRLNLGCGFDIRQGYVNFDSRSLPGVDIAAPVDPFYPRLPFADEEFDEIMAYHVLEHAANKSAIIEEIWRIASHNAVIKIKLPDRRHSDAFLDPTHLSYWEVDTIDFFLPGHQRSYYSPAKFGLMRKHTTSREIYWELLAIRHHFITNAGNTK
jgi:glycosyltransferase involved in cell wall biosynthesis